MVEREQPFAKKGLEPHDATRFPSQVVGDNVRALRTLRKLKQTDLSERMQRLGHGSWSRVTVSDVERYRRSISIDEIYSLALSLHTTVLALLDPAGVSTTGPSGGISLGVTVGESSDTAQFSPEIARSYIANGSDPWSITPDVAIAWEGNAPTMFIRYETGRLHGFGELPAGSRLGSRIGQHERGAEEP